jgi:hypothetical protein
MMSPVRLRLLGVMKGDHEEHCHSRLGAFRLHGEWFAPAETVLEFIRENVLVPRPGLPAPASSPQQVGELLDGQTGFPDQAP